MNAFSRWLAACFVAGVYCLVTLGLPTASGASAPRASYLHTVLSQHPVARRTLPASAHLDYHGGHVLSRVKVDLVVWDTWTYGRSVPLTGVRSIAGFLGGITASSYLDWLSEYDTPSQHIKRGTLEGVYTVHPPGPANGTTVSDTAIADGLRAMITDGRLPRPTTNRFYVVVLRSGQTVFTPGGNSRDDFCAYHDTMAYSSSSTAYFAVIPYEVGNRGCKAASTTFDSVTTVISHELIEGITDPGVGLSRIAWYDPANGEIGDICAGVSSPATVIGGDGVRYVVQREWSNRAHACIVAR